MEDLIKGVMFLKTDVLLYSDKMPNPPEKYLSHILIYEKNQTFTKTWNVGGETKKNPQKALSTTWYLIITI